MRSWMPFILLVLAAFFSIFLIPDGDAAEEIDDVIYIYSSEEVESEYMDGDPIGPGDEVLVYSYYPYDLALEPVVNIRLKLLDPLTGEVMKEEIGDPYMVEMTISGDDLPSSMYILRAEGINETGAVVYFSERNLLVDNPVDLPMAGIVIGTGIGIAAGVGAGVAVSSITTTSTASVGAASSASAGTGTSTWKNLLFGFATEYGEEKLKERTGKKAPSVKGSEKGFISKREILVIAVTVVFMMIAFGYVGMMERIAPHNTIGILGVDIFTIPAFSFLNFLIVLPMVLFTSVIVILAVEIAEEASAKMLGLWSEFRIWPIGLITLMVSSVFLMPFGYPGRAIPKGNVKITRRMEGFIGCFVLTTMLVLCLPFSLIYLIGYSVGSAILSEILMAFGGLGLSMLSMMLLAGAVPFKPMDGSKVWKMNKLLSLGFLLSAIVIFWFWNFSFFIVPPLFSDWFIPFGSWVGAMLMLLAGVVGVMILLMMSALGIWKGRDRGEDDYFDEEE